MEALIVPPFDSELKRTSLKASATSKMATLVLESGTSVAPRQRPKGSAQPSHNLPLVAPPSPSPRNTVSSPSLPHPDHHVTTTTTTNETFSAQFQANFPPVSNVAAPVVPSATTIPPPTAVVATVSTVPTALVQQPLTQQQTTNSLTNVPHHGDSENLDNLFQSKFPDPFSETQPPPASVLSGSGGLFTSPEAIAQLQQQMQQDIIMPLEVVGTPTKSSAVQLLTAPKVGHRRNMSDTSAFNKYIYIIYF